MKSFSFTLRKITLLLLISLGALSVKGQAGYEKTMPINKQIEGGNEKKYVRLSTILGDDGNPEEVLITLLDSTKTKVTNTLYTHSLLPGDVLNGIENLLGGTIDSLKDELGLDVVDFLTTSLKASDKVIPMGYISLNNYVPLIPSKKYKSNKSKSPLEVSDSVYEETYCLSLYSYFKQNYPDILDSIGNVQLRKKNYKRENLGNDICTALKSILEDSTFKLKNKPSLFAFDELVKKNLFKPIDSLCEKGVGNFVVHDLQLEFRNGFMGRVIAKGQYHYKGMSKELVFQNEYSIGFSSLKNFSKLSDIRLSADNHKHCKITLGGQNGIIENVIPHVVAERRDYGPANKVYRFGEADINSSKKHVLHKTAVKSLFDFRIYSDALGITNPTSPNGLVQVELSKRMNINTSRFDIPLNGGVGLANHLTPYFHLAKLENNLRSLPITDLSTDEPYVTITQLHQFKNFEVGIDLNVLTLEYQDVKLELELDFITSFAQNTILPNVDITNILTTDASDEFVTTLNLYNVGGEVSANFLMEENYGFSMSFKLINTSMANHIEVKGIANGEEDIDALRLKTTPSGKNNQKNAVLITPELEVWVKMNKAGKFFARYQYNYASRHPQWNYAFLQFGV